MKREIVTLSGSTKFEKEFRETAKSLTLQGKIVLMPTIYSKSEGLNFSEKKLNCLFEIHIDKISISDSLFVIDVGGYIGDNTEKEINFAKSKGKIIEYFSGRKE